MNTARLPASYVPVRKIDLQKNIRQAILVNAGCLVLLILMILIGCLFHPAGMIFSSPALLYTTRSSCLSALRFICSFTNGPTAFS